jgi:hypothetical protein
LFSNSVFDKASIGEIESFLATKILGTEATIGSNKLSSDKHDFYTRCVLGMRVHNLAGQAS